MTDPKDPWLTVMFKLDTYCHATVGVTTGLCVGGDWFYYLFKDNKFSYFDGVPAYGKAKAFCIDCHDPVQRGDFLWTAFSGLLKAQKSTSKGGGSGDPGKNLAGDCAGTSPLYLPPILPGVPGDVKSDPASKLPEQAQLMFDCLSWRSFLALNMEAQVEPAPGTTAEWRGLPRLGAGLTNEGPRVWETYRSVFETFQPGRPDWKLDKRSWDDPEHFAPVCKQVTINDKVLRMTGKQRYSEIIDEAHQAFGNQFNILVDQNSNLAHFEVRLNRDEFEFLKKTHYANTGNYNVGGPNKLLRWKIDPALQFPDNRPNKTGAIEIKAAWREMCTDSSCLKVDDLSHYFTRDAIIYRRDPLGGDATCRPAKVGLVGFHIAHKTYYAPQWVWSTFEHVENVPKVGDVPIQQTDRKTKYSFYSPWMQWYAQDAATCMKQRPGVAKKMPVKPNEVTVAACPNLQNIANSHPKGVPPPPYAVVSPSPNQVTRLDKMSSSPLNLRYQKELEAWGSVFQYFRLVNTQWPLNGRTSDGEVKMRACTDDVKEPCYNVKPSNLRLRNTTMETYQVSYHMPGKTGQASSAGCMQCHGISGVDFSFVWTDAVTAPVPLE